MGNEQKITLDDFLSKAKQETDEAIQETLDLMKETNISTGDVTLKISIQLLDRIDEFGNEYTKPNIDYKVSNKLSLSTINKKDFIETKDKQMVLEDDLFTVKKVDKRQLELVGLEG